MPSTAIDKTKGKKQVALKPSPVLEASHPLARRNRWPWMWAGHSELPPWWKSETEMITEPRKVIGACLTYLVQHPDDLPDLFVPEHYACRQGDLWVDTQRAEDCLHMVVHAWSKLGDDGAKNVLRSMDAERLLVAVRKLHQVAVKSGMISDALAPDGVASKAIRLEWPIIAPSDQRRRL